MVSGFLSAQYPEEHGVYLPPGQELSDQQSDPQPLPVLSAAEVLWGWHVQRRWEENMGLDHFFIKEYFTIPIKKKPMGSLAL